MIRQYQLIYKRSTSLYVIVVSYRVFILTEFIFLLRLMATKFPDEACREAFIKAASCKREATRLDNYEACGMCLPVHQKDVTVPDEIAVSFF